MAPIMQDLVGFLPATDGKFKGIQARSQDLPGGGSFFLDTVLWAWHLIN